MYVFFSFIPLCIYLIYSLRHPHGALRSRQNPVAAANGTTAAAATAASMASTTRPGWSHSIYTGFVTERGRPLECKRQRRSWSTAPSRRFTEESLAAELAQDGQCSWHKHRVNKQRNKREQRISAILSHRNTNTLVYLAIKKTASLWGAGQKICRLARPDVS